MRRSVRVSDCSHAIKIHHMDRSGIFIIGMQQVTVKRGPGSALHNRVHKLRMDGLTLVEIAKEMGFSVVRARQIVTFQQFKARKQIYDAIKRGKLIKPKTCQQCGGTTKIQAHHNDYTKPFDVRWLCHTCHNKYPRTPYFVRPIQSPIPIFENLILKAKKVSDDWGAGRLTNTAIEQLDHARDAANSVVDSCSGVLVRKE